MTEKELKNFGFRLRQKRTEMNKNQEEVASLIDVHPRTYANWENGRQSPPLDKTVIMATKLKTTVSELLGESQPSAKESFNGNIQEGENLTMNNQMINIDREMMQEINQRFAFLEKIIEEERSQNKKLLDAILSK